MFEVDFHILNQKATPAIYADDLSVRPNPGFGGRIFINTASPYGVYRDTGSAWVQVASNGGGGGGSTGINGLNGTTEIGLGGTLLNDVTISGDNQYFISLNNLKGFVSESNVDGVDISQIENVSTQVRFFVKNVDENSQTFFTINKSKIFSSFNNLVYGIDINMIDGLFALGDYNLQAGKKNSIQISDSSDEIYFTSGLSESRNVPDLFKTENSGSDIRYAKLGDVGNVGNGTLFEINDKLNGFIQSNFNLDNVGNSAYGILINKNEVKLGDFEDNLNGTRFIVDTKNQVIQAGFTDFTQSQGFELNYGTGNFIFGCYAVPGTADNYILCDYTSLTLYSDNLNLNGNLISNSASGLIPPEFLTIYVNGSLRKIQLFG